MPNSRTIHPPAASARDLDAQCRGLGGSSAFGDEPGMGRGRALRTDAPIDVPTHDAERRPRGSRGGA